MVGFADDGGETVGLIGVETPALSVAEVAVSSMIGTVVGSTVSVAGIAVSVGLSVGVVVAVAVGVVVGGGVAVCVGVKVGVGTAVSAVLSAGVFVTVGSSVAETTAWAEGEGVGVGAGLALHPTMVILRTIKIGTRIRLLANRFMIIILLAEDFIIERSVGNENGRFSAFYFLPRRGGGRREKSA